MIFKSWALSKYFPVGSLCTLKILVQKIEQNSAPDQEANIIQGDQDIFKISPSIIVNLTKSIALQGEILHIFAGKNTVSGTIFSLGIIYSK